MKNSIEIVAFDVLDGSVKVWRFSVGADNTTRPIKVDVVFETKKSLQ